MAHTEEMLVNGAMTPVTVFDQTAQAIDDAAAGFPAVKQTTDTLEKEMPQKAPLESPAFTGTPTLNGAPFGTGGGGGIGRNLLDNWYFANPVDQRNGYVVPPNTEYFDNSTLDSRGHTEKYYAVLDFDSGDPTLTSYISIDGTKYRVAPGNAVRGYTGTGYTIDRWKTDIDEGGAVLVTSEGITLTAAEMYWGTRLENPGQFAGRKLTASALTADGVLHYGTVLFENVVEVPQVFFDDGLVFYINAPSNGIAQVEFSSHEPNITIVAAKLELGSVQTLAHQEDGEWVLNEIPDYGEELAKCQRYQVVMTVRVKPGGNQEWASYPVVLRANPQYTVLHGEDNRVSVAAGNQYGFNATNSDSSYSRPVTAIFDANL